MNNTFMCHNNWIKESSHEETIGFLRSIALSHAICAGPYAVQIEEILLNRDWNSLVDFGIDYRRGSPLELYHARQSLAFFEKLECLPLGRDKEAVAWKKFREAEEKCAETNRRLRLFRRVPWLSPGSRVESVLYTAQQKITEVLGDVPSLHELKFSFGPGANTNVKARASSSRWKLEAQPMCSVELVPVLEPVLRCFPHYSELHRSPTRGLLRALEDHLDNFRVEVGVSPGKLQFVPKNAKTYRSIVVEPILNSLCQKGIGSYLKGRLRKAGIDLRTQSQLNKTLAQRASFDGSLATIDLSAASDTISLEVVNELLPPDWVSFLRNFRTGTVTYQGDTITLEKFSSMGNAFTFELETLIFWAVAWACASVERLNSRETFSFGDDILLPTGAVSLLFETLAHLGFSVNTEKSFWEGPFRESCGGDYVNGIDIRPYYQKDLVSGRTLFTLHNYYVRTFQPEFANKVLQAIPESLRIWGPDGYGDGHLIGSWHHAAKHTKKIREHGFGGVVFETFSLKKRVNKTALPKGDRLLPLYMIYVQGDYNLNDDIDYVEPPINPGDLSDVTSCPYTVRGHKGYKRLSIYTLSTGVLLP